MTSDMRKILSHVRKSGRGAPDLVSVRRVSLGTVEAEEVSFGVLECCDEAHALSDFGFGEGDGACGGGDLGEGVVDGVDLDVVHEGLAGVLAGHESAVDAGVSVLGFDGPVVHVPGVGDLPSEGLKQFRESCKSRGLLESYSGPRDFHSKFLREIQLKINQDEYFTQSNAYEPTQELIASPVITLSREAQELLRVAASSDGTVMHVRSLGGANVQAGRRLFVEPHSPRSDAIWEAAIQDLVNEGFLQPVGHGGELFKVTHAGYEYFDLYLKEQAESAHS